MADPEDMMMYNWQGTIIGPANSVHDGRIYGLRITCGDNYPMQAPLIRFQSRINLPCVGPDGTVNPRGFPLLANWTREKTLEHVLVELRREMASPANRKLPQPPEGSVYF